MAATVIDSEPCVADVAGVILAAGRGQRLGALTDQRPKPLVPLLNRPLADWIAADFAAADIGRIAMNLHHLPEQMTAWALGVPARLPVSVSTVTETALTGPAGGMLAVADLVDDARAVLVVSGDVCTELGFRAVIEDHRARDAAMTIVTQRVDDPRRFGQLAVDLDGLVTAMIRDPAVRLSEGIISTGMYVMSPVAIAVLRDLGGSVADLDFDRHLVPELLRRGLPVATYATTAYWNDVGLPEALLAANLHMLGTDRVARVSRPCSQAGPDVWCEGDHPSIAGKVIGPVLLGTGVSIAAGAIVQGPAVLAAGTSVMSGATIESSVTVDAMSVPVGVHRYALLHSGPSARPE